MSNDDEKQPSKRGRPKKVKTEEEITFEKQRRKENKQKWYQDHKDDIHQKHKKYYEEYKEYKHEELNTKSKILQSRYREGYRLLYKLFNDKAIMPSYKNIEEIEKFIGQ